MKKLFILEKASWCEIATGMYHTGFLLVLEMTSSLTCKGLQKNSVSVIHSIELATAESNTHMCYSTVSRSSQIDSKTPALASHQAAPQLTNAFKRMLLL